MPNTTEWLRILDPARHWSIVYPEIGKIVAEHLDRWDVTYEVGQTDLVLSLWPDHGKNDEWFTKRLHRALRALGERTLRGRYCSKSPSDRPYYGKPCSRSVWHGPDPAVPALEDPAPVAFGDGVYGLLKCYKTLVRQVAALDPDDPVIFVRLNVLRTECQNLLARSGEDDTP